LLTNTKQYLHTLTLRNYYELEREPNPENREYVQYNKDKDIVEIKQRPKTQDELDFEAKQKKIEEIRKLYSLNDELKILRKAIATLVEKDIIKDEGFEKYNNDINAIVRVKVKPINYYDLGQELDAHHREYIQYNKDIDNIVNKDRQSL